MKLDWDIRGTLTHTSRIHKCIAYKAPHPTPLSFVPKYCALELEARRKGCVEFARFSVLDVITINVVTLTGSVRLCMHTRTEHIALWGSRSMRAIMLATS